jgi:hypothetical protein
MLAFLAVFVQVALLLTMHIVKLAFGSRKSVLYGGLARMMGDIFSSLVLMQIVPFSGQFFFLLAVKFVGRLATDLDWIVYFPKWLYKQIAFKCCYFCCRGNVARAGTKLDNAEEKMANSHIANITKVEEYIEQVELSNLSLFTEAVALSAILVVFASIWVVARGEAACTSPETCPYYQPIASLPLFQRLISCDTKMYAAISSYTVLWAVCGCRIAFQNAFLNLRFQNLDRTVQKLALKPTRHQLHTSLGSGNVFSDRATRQNMMTIDKHGCLLLYKHHSFWHTLAGVSVIVQVLVACAGLNLRPYGVAPKIAVTPSLSFLCDVPANPLEVTLNSTMRWKVLSCRLSPQDASQDTEYEQMANQSVSEIHKSMQMYGSLHPEEEMDCCSILRTHAMRSGSPVRMGLLQPEPEPETQPDGSLKKISCGMYDGWSEPKPESKSKPESEPESEPELEPN